MTINNQTYAFDELSEQSKDKARSAWRETNLDYAWWDGVYEDLSDAAKLIGIDIDCKGNRNQTPAIYFSGFCSQGDGACFEGIYRYKKGSVAAIKEEFPQDQELQAIAQVLYDVQKRNFFKLGARTKHRGHYCDAYSMSIDVWHSDDQYKDIANAEDDIKELMHDFANWIYRSLEREYDWLQSDETIDEAILTNEVQFTEEGDIV